MCQLWLVSKMQENCEEWQSQCPKAVGDVLKLFVLFDEQSKTSK